MAVWLSNCYPSYVWVREQGCDERSEGTSIRRERGREKLFMAWLGTEGGGQPILSDSFIWLVVISLPRHLMPNPCEKPQVTTTLYNRHDNAQEHILKYTPTIWWVKEICCIISRHLEEGMTHQNDSTQDEGWWWFIPSHPVCSWKHTKWVYLCHADCLIAVCYRHLCQMDWC